MSSKKKKSYTTPTVTATLLADSSESIPSPNRGSSTKSAGGESNNLRLKPSVAGDWKKTSAAETAGDASRSDSAAESHPKKPVAPIVFSPINEAKTKEFLTQHKWPSGVQDALIRSCKKIPIRFIITDDSGSMMTNDGHRIIGMGTKNVKMIQCTRWSELTASLSFHAELAHQAKALTEFRLLNNSEPIMIGKKDDINGAALESLLAVFDDNPGGQTPLCRQVAEVIESIRACEPELRANGQKACVIIATDGESTDGDLADAMRPLQELPVWVVVRLCTDEDPIVEYWNNIDNQLELEMDVLDDFSGEAAEVTAVNPWLAYGDPLQKLREFGATVKEMDLLDESALSSEQMRVICALLVCGFKVRSLPHPDEDWQVFITALKGYLQNENLVWDPLVKEMRPWIDLKKLTNCYRYGIGGSSSGKLKSSSSGVCVIQ